MHNLVKNNQLQFTSRFPAEIVKHVGDAAGVPVSIGDKIFSGTFQSGVSGLVRTDSR